MFLIKIYLGFYGNHERPYYAHLTDYRLVTFSTRYNFSHTPTAFKNYYFFKNYFFFFAIRPWWFFSPKFFKLLFSKNPPPTTRV